MGRPEKATKVDPRDRRQLEESPVRPRRVMELFRPHARPLALVTVLIIVTSIVGLAQPFLIKRVIDDALPNRDTDLLVWATVGMVAVAAVSGLLSVVQTWLATSIGQRVMHSLRVAVFAHLQDQSLDFFKRTRGGEIQSRMTNDIAAMRSVVTNTATSVASNLTTAVAAAVAMVALDWQLALITALVLPPAVLSTRKVAMTKKALTGARQRQLAEIQTQVDESLSVSGALLTKTLGIKDQRLVSYTTSSAALIDLDLRAELAGRWRTMTMQIVFAIIPAAVYLAAGTNMMTHPVSIGTIVAFTALQVVIFRPIMGLLNMGAQWIASMALLSRIFGYLDLPIGVPAPEHPVPIDRALIRGDVVFEDVHFSYPDGDEPVLDGVNVRIPAGGSLGVAGETGSGKSTLASLLIRLADPTRGRRARAQERTSLNVPPSIHSILPVKNEESGPTRK